MLRIDPGLVENVAKELYIRALKILPPDIKQGFAALAARETAPTAQNVLGTMIQNIAVAEATDNLLCQDTGIPIYNVTIGRGVQFGDGDGAALKAAIRKGCERATREHPLRSSVVHPITRKNEHTSCGPGIPPIHIDFSDDERLVIQMIPKGSGSENNSWLKMAFPADGVDAIKTFVVDCVLEAGGKTCPPTIVGVGIGGTSDLCVSLAKKAATRPLGSACVDPEGAKLENLLTEAVNTLGKAMIPAGPVLSPQQALEHPHIRAAGFMQDVDYPGLPNPAPTARAAVRLSETPGEIVTRPPTLGEHTDRVLADIGYDAEAIAALRNKGII